MKSDSSFLNFILGIILLLLLAIAAKAQTKPVNPKNFKTQNTVKKKPVTAEEARDIFEKKNAGQNVNKRKSYSRKDIEDGVTGHGIPQMGKTATENIVIDAVKTTAPVADNTISKQPKAIYTGPQNKNTGTEKEKKGLVKPKELIFIEHIEIESGGVK